MNNPGEPAPWLHLHPSKQWLHSYYGPVRQPAPPRYSVPSVAASARSLLATGGQKLGPVNDRRIGARLPTFRARAADRAHAVSTPWRHLVGKRVSARLLPRGKAAPRFRRHLGCFRRLNNDHQSDWTPHRQLLDRLPGPHLTRSGRAFSLSLTTTVLSQRSRGWFGAYPRRPTPKGHPSFISCTASPSRGTFLHDSSFSVRGARFRHPHHPGG